MPARADWMIRASIPVVELLVETQLWLSPVGIWLNLRARPGDAPSRSSVHRAVGPLVEHELVERHPDRENWLRATDKAERYLAGKIAPDEL